MVDHRRRRRDANGATLRQEQDRLAVHLAVERHLVDPFPTLEETLESARVHDRAGEKVCTRRLALLEHCDRHLAEPLGRCGILFHQLSEPDRRCEPGGAGADDQEADFDPLVDRIRRRRDRVGRRPRRRELRRTNAHDLRLRTSSVSLGTISCRSPTTPRSEYSKIGAFGSLLIATITFDPCIPTLCWIAPEMPSAT